jgi:transcriptional regulator with XRE-family HTH domain
MSTLIADRMKERGFNDDASLASVVGCDRSMINRIRRGEATPSLPLAVKLSEALDLPASTFVPPDGREAEHAAQPESDAA